MAMKTAKKSNFKKPTVVVGVGTSAGGTAALKQFFGGLQKTSSIAFIIVQHTDENGKALALDVLKSVSTLPVFEIENGTKLQAQAVYLAPPHTCVSIQEGAFTIESCETRESSDAVIDHLFKSLAAAYTMKSVGVILSGEGNDGSLGLRTLSEQGGMTIVQDPETADYRTMPESALDTGNVDHTLRPNAMGLQLQSYEDYILNVIEGKALHSLRDQIGLSLHKICAILLKETHHDFKHYKTTTLIRRIQRRMQVLQIEAAEVYIKKLEQSQHEVDALFKELLINVTSFFRDPEAFESLREEVIAKTLPQLPKDQKYRVWVAGCSTGEEVYTLAIMIQEEILKLDRKVEVQIIATDIDDVALNIARKGSYPLTIASNVSPERLAKHFQKRAGRYHVNKEIREMCLFSA
ncbi:MAG: ATPase, partial [Proteobacteria bacterium]